MYAHGPQTGVRNQLSKDDILNYICILIKNIEFLVYKCRITNLLYRIENLLYRIEHLLLYRIKNILYRIETLLRRIEILL